MQAWNSWGQQATPAAAVGSYGSPQTYQAGQVFQSGQVSQAFPGTQVPQAYAGAQAYPGAQVASNVVPAQQMMTNYQQFYGAAMPATTGEVPAGYTPQQWEAAQQQHYMQWQQWNQQFQQWQQDYGNTYSMAVQGVPAVAPPSSVAEPPPLPPPDKPPPPPDDGRSMQLEPANFQVPPPESALGFQGQKRPPTEDGQSKYQGPADKKQRGDSFQPYGQGSGVNQWGPTTEELMKPEEEEDRSEQEKSFDAQFLLWEGEFKNWKDQNINHPDKTQYNEYEIKWTKWRQELLQRREQMRKKRLAGMAKTSPEVSARKAGAKADRQAPRNVGNDFGNDPAFRGAPSGGNPTNGKPEIKSLLDMPLQFTGQYAKKGYGADAADQSSNNAKPQGPHNQQADPKGFSKTPNNRGLPFDNNFAGPQQGKINFNFNKPGMGQQLESQVPFGPQPKPVGPSPGPEGDGSKKVPEEDFSQDIQLDDAGKTVEKGVVDLTQDAEPPNFDFFKKSNVIPGLDLFSEKPSDAPVDGKADGNAGGVPFGPRIQTSQGQGFEFPKGPPGPGQGLMPTPGFMNDPNFNQWPSNDGRMNQGPGQHGQGPFGPQGMTGNTPNNQNQYMNTGNQNSNFGPGNEGANQNFGPGNQGYMNSHNNGPNMGPGGQNSNFPPGNMGSNFTSPNHKGPNMGQQNQNFNSGGMGPNFPSQGNTGPTNQHGNFNSGNMGPNFSPSKGPNFSPIKGPNMGIQPPNMGVQPPNMGVQPPNMGVQPPNMGVQPPNMGVQPPNMGIQPPNMGVQPPNMGVQPPNMGVQPPNMGVQPPNFGTGGPTMGPGNHSQQAPNFGPGGPNFGPRDQGPTGPNFGPANQKPNFGPGNQGTNFGIPNQGNRNNQGFGQNFGPKSGDQPGFMRGPQQTRGPPENQNFPGGQFGNGPRNWADDPEGRNQGPPRDNFSGQGPNNWGDNSRWNQGGPGRDPHQQGPPRDMNQGPRDNFPTRSIPDLRDQRPGMFPGGPMNHLPPKDGLPGDNKGGKEPLINKGFPEDRRGNFQGQEDSRDGPPTEGSTVPDPRDHFQNKEAKPSGDGGSGFAGPPRDGFSKDRPNFPGGDGPNFSGPPRDGFSKEGPSFPGRDGSGFPGLQREGVAKERPNFPIGDGPGFPGPLREGFPKEGPNFPGADNPSFSGPPREGFPQEGPNFQGPRDGFPDDGPNYRGSPGDRFPGDREGHPGPGDNQGPLREPFPNSRFGPDMRGNPRDHPLERDRFNPMNAPRGGFPDRDLFRDDFRGREDLFRGERGREHPFDDRGIPLFPRERELASREYDEFGHGRGDGREAWDQRMGGRPPPHDYFRPPEQFDNREGDPYRPWNRPPQSWTNNFQLEPATIVEYGHKPAPPSQLLKSEPGLKVAPKSLEPVQTFDYGHGTAPTRHIRDIVPSPTEPRRRDENHGRRDREVEREGRESRWERGRREDGDKMPKYGQEEDRFRGRSDDRWGRRGERDNDRNGRSRDNKRDGDSGRGARGGPPPAAPPPPSFTSDSAPGDNKPAASGGSSQPTQRPILVEDLLVAPGRDSRPQRIVVILRGPPGSGKTFVAKLIKDKEVEMGGSPPRILCLDDYFMVEVEKEEKDPETGRKVKVKAMEFEYESGMEKNYRSSLVKAFKKTVNENYFPFVIVDCVNQEVKHFEEMWSYAKQKGFQVYICEMDMDVSSCMKRNTHNRTEKEIADIVKAWEDTPKYYLRLDVRSLLQSVAITEVEMEDSNPNEEEEKPEAKEEKAEEESNEADEDSGASVSKWERMEPSEDKLDRLDGLKRRKGDEKPKTLEDWLQLSDDYEKRETKPGQKRVRWADLEEKREQEKMRAIGFVVGQTDWSRMTDPTFGESALTQTKYI